MIEEDYVSFEVAKLLKEKGFDGPCYKVWESHGNSRNLVGAAWFVEGETVVNRESVDAAAKQYAYEYNINNNVEGYLAPTLQMVIKWIRKKGFHIFAPLEIDYDEDERGIKWYHDAAYYPEIIRISDGKAMYDDGSLYAEPEQAYEVAIKYYLENLI
jgi:hypothetical protein